MSLLSTYHNYYFIYTLYLLSKLIDTFINISDIYRHLIIQWKLLMEKKVFNTYFENRLCKFDLTTFKIITIFLNIPIGYLGNVEIPKQIVSYQSFYRYNLTNTPAKLKHFCICSSKASIQ